MKEVDMIYGDLESSMKTRHFLIFFEGGCFKINFYLKDNERIMLDN